MPEKEPVFKPFPLFSGCHAQTIVASFFTYNRDPSSVTWFIHLFDGERISMEVTTPSDWSKDQPTIVMVHGLCGSHKSPYAVRLAKKLSEQGIRSIRVNLRGCGSGRGHAKRMYHAEASEDVWHALKEIKRNAPNSPLIVIGFSLGGNIILKMGGDKGDEALSVVDKIIAINPPLDMHSCIRRIGKNRIYERFFMRALKADAEYRSKKFKDLPSMEISSSMTLHEFIDKYTAPQAGFLSAEEYYLACSSGRLISSITIKSHILFSRDDPIVDCTYLDSIDIPKNVNILITEHGGHLGFLGTPGKKGGFHWMDSLLLQWIFE